MLLRYWGKSTTTSAYHPAVYHMLDVATVAQRWWDRSSVVQKRLPEKHWLLFFVAIHDIGKIDVRFQRRRDDLALVLHPTYTNNSAIPSEPYYHGEAGYSLLHFDHQWPHWENWKPWLSAVAGHHGSIPVRVDEAVLKIRAADSVIDYDRVNRLSVIQQFAALFGVDLEQSPPAVNARTLAGFCSVCDWLGSNSNVFTATSESMRLLDYYTQRLPLADDVLDDLIRAPSKRSGMSLFPNTPRGVQAWVDTAPVSQSLTIIEAPTGEGKTEAAIGYASRLLAAELAECIIFALPTQATANAMLPRVEGIAPLLFKGIPNVALAHGKSKFTPRLSNSHTQCAEFLATNKRAFLGQIGVATIDQVLMSSLTAVRHDFVRGFALARSVLIVDEVHAYDAYSTGLLEEIVKEQRQNGGSVILLSATLASHQKGALIKAWGAKPETNNSYPLITHCDTTVKPAFKTTKASSRKKVTVELQKQALPDAALLERIINADANVAIICNTVAEAQSVHAAIKALGVSVTLFHSRYQFVDRQKIEQWVINRFGPGTTGADIVVATQVIEQSLDIDFDWMITQHCPIDLLIQRMGRLFRHAKARPAGFKAALCTVLLPEDDSLHRMIYGNDFAPATRTLWRSRQVLRDLQFPDDYRDLIENVYAIDPWPNEPSEITQAGLDFLAGQRQLHTYAIQQTTTQGIEHSTRDGEMGKAVCLLCEGALLTGEPLYKAGPKRLEQLNIYTIPIPASWRLEGQFDEGVLFIDVHRTNKNTWRNEEVTYSNELGLSKL